jgi:phosphoglycerate dehydrogenase-like enzyme
VTQHRAVVAGAGRQPVRRPEGGPIAILPEHRDVFADAIVAGGGVVAELSDETRGIVWLSSSHAEHLVATLDAHPQIGWVQLPWAGVDAFAHVLAKYAGTERPLWTSAKGAYSQPVAEHALALTLALLRSLPMRAGATSWGSGEIGESLYGRSVLIVGAGGIAVELVRLLAPFDVHITAVRRSAEPLAGAERTVTGDRLLEVLPEADVVVIAAAFTEGTKHLIAAPELAAMKQTAVLVNIARGGLIDTDALVEALAAETIAGAALDVTDPEPLPDGHPLWTEPRALITPHAADTPTMTAPLLAERIRENVVALLGDGDFVGIVDTEAGY